MLRLTFINVWFCINAIRTFVYKSINQCIITPLVITMGHLSSTFLSHIRLLKSHIAKLKLGKHIYFREGGGFSFLSGLKVVTASCHYFLLRGHTPRDHLFLFVYAIQIKLNWIEIRHNIERIILMHSDLGLIWSYHSWTDPSLATIKYENSWFPEYDNSIFNKLFLEAQIMKERFS